MIETQLTTLGILFGFAILGGLIANKIRQPVVLGLLIIGAVIGPNMFGLVKDQNMVNILIDFGTILLLFVIGLEFSVQKLLKTGVRALLITVFKIAVTFFFGYLTGLALGFSIPTCAFIGIILSFTSTVVVVKVLEDRGMIGRREVPLLLGVLILEDIVAVLSITFIDGMAGNSAAGALGSVERIFIGLTALVAIYSIFAALLAKLVNWVLANYNGEEAVVFLSFGLCAGFAYLASYLGLSTGVGAFLAGSIVSSFRESREFERAVHPYTLIFSSMFFIAIGTMINFSKIMDYWIIILVLLIALLITRFISIGLTTSVFANFKDEQMFFSTIAMFSVGEFSLLIANKAAGFEPRIDLVTITAMVIFITALLMSICLSYSKSLYDYFNTSHMKAITSRVGGFSSFMRSLFNELDNETTTVKALNRMLYSAVGHFLILVFALVITRKLGAVAMHNGYRISSYLLYLAGFFIAALLIFRIYRALVRVKGMLIDVIMMFEVNRSWHRSNYILTNLFYGTIIVLFGLASPALIFILSLKGYFIFGSVAMVLIGILFLRRASRIFAYYREDHKYNVPSYKKIKRQA